MRMHHIKTVTFIVIISIIMTTICHTKEVKTMAVCTHISVTDKDNIIPDIDDATVHIDTSGEMVKELAISDDFKALYDARMSVKKSSVSSDPTYEDDISYIENILCTQMSDYIYDSSSVKAGVYTLDDAYRQTLTDVGFHSDICTGVRFTLTYSQARKLMSYNSNDTLMYIVEQVIIRNPILGTLFPSVYYGTDSDGYYMEIYSPVAASQIRTVTKKYRKQLEKMEKIPKTDSTMSDIEKLLYIHDQLITSAYYSENNIGMDHIPAACAVYNKAVCQSYATEFSQMANDLGFECYQIDSNSHGWNLVCVDGKWCYVDATWDDSGSDYDYVSHQFFLVPWDAFKISSDKNATAHKMCAPYDDIFDSIAGQSGDYYPDIYPKKNNITRQLNYVNGTWYFAHGSRNPHIYSWDGISSDVSVIDSIYASGSLRCAALDNLIYYSDTSGIYLYSPGSDASMRQLSDTVTGMYSTIDTLYYKSSGTWKTYLTSAYDDVNTDPVYTIEPVYTMAPDYTPDISLDTTLSPAPTLTYAPTKDPEGFSATPSASPVYTTDSHATQLMPSPSGHDIQISTIPSVTSAATNAPTLPIATDTPPSYTYEHEPTDTPYIYDTTYPVTTDTPVYTHGPVMAYDDFCFISYDDNNIRLSDIEILKGASRMVSLRTPEGTSPDSLTWLSSDENIAIAVPFIDKGYVYIMSVTGATGTTVISATLGDRTAFLIVNIVDEYTLTQTPTPTKTPDNTIYYETQTPTPAISPTVRPSVTNPIKPGRVTISKIKNNKRKNNKRKKLTISWKKVKYATKYVIQVSLNKKFKKKNTKKTTVKSTKKSVKIKGLKRKKTYYIRARAISSANGKNLYGKWSKIKKKRTT